MPDSSSMEESSENVMLCASCDRCRSRKTKCDGERPCGGCKAKYKKQTGVTNIDGVPYHLFECVYSPAKRRGPHPGHKRKTEDSVTVEGESSTTVNPEEPPASLHKVPTIHNHWHLLSDQSHVGNLLRSYYQLAVNELVGLDGSSTLPACQFAELAIGALVKNNIALAMELCNAVVHCLQQESFMHSESSSSSVLFDMAKTYYLLGIFRAYRGDFTRYFKYRRVCLSYLSKLPNDDRTYTLLAAVSYLDGWAYMIHNANDETLECHAIPPPADTPSSSKTTADEIESKYNIRKDACHIASNPANGHWIQGPPPVFLNNEAPVSSRVLDALACAFRTCCDTANGRNCETKTPSVTATAVLNHENELCSRNMVLSAYSLLQQNSEKSDGQQLVVSSMDAFFENAGGDGLTDGQVNTLLAVCNTVLQNPFVLHHPGPTYHMITNAAVLLAHLLNGMTSAKESLDEMESTLYDEVYDTYVAIRRVLILHRRKLPAKIRCHDLPRATVDLGETLLCSSRSCQGFVLQACSPCVAAERAKRAAEQLKVVEAQEAEAMDLGELPRDTFPDFDMDDDTLLDMITGLIQQ